MTYELATVSCPDDIALAETLRVADFRWQRGYEPRTLARAVYVKNDGFLIRMECAESEPRALYTEPDDQVHRDSCMECFINFAPETDARYINLEANANGALHCKFGAGRSDRVSLRALGLPLPTVEAYVGDTGWMLDFFVPLGCVAALYGRGEFSDGAVFRANFYKCGDETALPHYGMWSGVDTPQPDFHRPEYFGELVFRE